MRRYALPVYAGLLHGINDAIAGFLLAVYSLEANISSQVVMAFLGYSLLAFGGQLPVGWLLDKFRSPRNFLVSAISILMMACLLAPWNLPVAILLSGVASAMVHVTGGTVCYLQDTRNSTVAGIFTAPGILGLILGGWVGQGASMYGLFVAVVVLFVFLILLWHLRLPEYTSLEKPEQQPLLETHDYIMLVLLLAIAMRSMIWNMLYQLAEQRSFSWLLAIGFAAFFGKLFGGWVIGKMNWKAYVFVSLGISAILLSLGRDVLPVFVSGVFLLQSAVPVTLWMMQQYLNRQPAAATALSLGMAIILAGLPAYLNEFRSLEWNNTWLAAAFMLLLLINSLWVIKTRSSQPKPS